MCLQGTNIQINNDSWVYTLPLSLKIVLFLPKSAINETDMFKIIHK